MSAESPHKPGRSRGKDYRFLLSAAARSLSSREIARLTPDEAYQLFRTVRFAENEGHPYCVRCGCDAIYEITTRRLFKCKLCEKQFSVTSGTIFHGRKMSIEDILYAISLFVNGVNGHAACRMSRDLNCSYKAAFVLLHKLRKTMGAMQAENFLTGEVEIDGVFIGGHVRQENIRKERKDRRKESAGKRRTIVTMRERRPNGRSKAGVFVDESDSIGLILDTVQPSAHVITDEGSHWGKLVIPFESLSTVNHSLGYSIDGVHINGIESQHSRIRRAERGVYLHINGAHASLYAQELSWRDDHRRMDNGRQFYTLLKRAAPMPIAREWVGYWRKRPRPEAAGAT